MIKKIFLLPLLLIQTIKCLEITERCNNQFGYLSDEYS